MKLLEQPLFTGTNFSMEGTRTYNGETVAIYRATGNNVASSSLSFGPYSYVTNSSITMYIDNDGLLHYVKITAKYDNSEIPDRKRYSDITTYRYTQKVTAIGSYDVSIPPWLGEAINRTSGN